MANRPPTIDEIAAAKLKVKIAKTRGGDVEPWVREIAEWKREWVINVCRTCDRLAEWPFCEHRDQSPVGTYSWCVAISVIPARRADRHASEVTQE